MKQQPRAVAKLSSLGIARLPVDAHARLYPAVRNARLIQAAQFPDSSIGQPVEKSAGSSVPIARPAGDAQPERIAPLPERIHPY